MNKVSDPGRVLYLPLYEQDGGSFMSQDAYGHACTVNGAAWRPQGRYFDGVNDVILCGNKPVLYTSGGTWEIWFRFTSGADNAYIVSTDGPGWQAGDAALRHLSNRLLFSLDNGTGYENINSDGPLNDGGYHHCACTFGRHGMKMYVDGLVQAAGNLYSGGTSGSATVLGLGGRALLSGYWNGTIGEVSIYNRALSAPEIQRRYLETRWRYR